MPETRDPVPDDHIVAFGSHQGRKIGDVGCAYLLWCLEQNWIKNGWPTVYRYVVENQDTLLEEYQEKYDRAWNPRA